MGISRSPTVVLAYLIEKKKMKFQESCQYTLQKRKVAPRPFFVSQLKLFERILSENNGLFDTQLPIYLQFTLEIKLNKLKELFDSKNKIKNKIQKIIKK
jgi:hypothetical protein